jgi:hypothetical protein
MAITTQQEAYDACAAVNDAARASYLDITNRGLETSRRRQEFAKVYVDARTKMGAIKQELAASRQDAYESVETELFGIPGPKPASAADRAALAANMRDALGRASDCETPSELLTVLRQWTVVGDVIGVRACAAVAFQRSAGSVFGGMDTTGWVTVIEAFAEDNPADADRILALTNPVGITDQAQIAFGMQMATSVAKPIELTTVPDWQLEQMASGAG